MNNNSSCPIYQINNINPPKKTTPIKVRERERLPVDKEEEEGEDELEGSWKTNWKGAGRRRWGHCCQRGFQHRRNQPLKAEPPLSSALISNQTLSPAHTHPFSLPLFASLASFDFSTLLLALSQMGFS
jgi:hypothetical protein